MPLLLVRHAVALRRRDWSKPDHLRPLTPRGYAQADVLVDVLEPYGVTRILSSPYVRCVETVEPLAAKLGLPVETVDALAEGAGDDAARLVPAMEGAVVLCSHGDVIPELFDVLAPDADLTDPSFPCEKGSTWVVDDDRRRATYLAPPATDPR